MVVELRCVILDLIAFIFKADALRVEKLELLEIDMFNVYRVGSTTKLTTVSSPYSKAIL